MGSIVVAVFVAEEAAVEGALVLKRLASAPYEVRVVNDPAGLPEHLREVPCVVVVGTAPETLVLEHDVATPRAGVIRVRSAQEDPEPATAGYDRVISVVEVTERLERVLCAAVTRHLIESCENAAMVARLFDGHESLRRGIVYLFGREPSPSVKGIGTFLGRKPGSVGKEWARVTAHAGVALPSLRDLVRVVRFLRVLDAHLLDEKAALGRLHGSPLMSDPTFRAHLERYGPRPSSGSAVLDIASTVVNVREEVLGWLRHG